MNCLIVLQTFQKILKNKCSKLKKCVFRTIQKGKKNDCKSRKIKQKFTSELPNQFLLFCLILIGTEWC